MKHIKYMPVILITFLLWGSSFIIFKVALRTLPPVTLLLCRYLVAVPVLFALLFVRGKLRPLARKDAGTIFTIGFMGFFFSFCLQMYAVERLTGSLSSLLGVLNPVFIPVLAAVFLKERITPAMVACICVSMTGVVVIVGVGGTAEPAGVLLMLASVFLWSGTSIIMRRIAGRYDPMQVVMMALICAIPFVGAWSAVELRTAQASFPLSTVLAVVYLATLGMAVPHSLWNYCLSRMDVSFCSMFYPLQPLSSATLGVLLLGEQITPSYVAGAAIICCGIVGTVVSGRNRA